MDKLRFDIGGVKTPCYVVDEGLLRKNLGILAHVKEKAGCKILLAQKAFSMFELYPIVGEYLDGTASSGLHEAKLGADYMGKENHVFSAAYTDGEMDEILDICDYVIFNSFAQWRRFKKKALAKGKKYGIRVNPEFSTQKDAIYNPCAPFSRLGVTKGNFKPQELDGLSGLHFHTLCQQNADALSATLCAVEKNFSKYFGVLRWINMGGGHHITRKDYDTDALIGIIKGFREKYGLDVYIEPGEAVALNAGFLVSTVLDIVDNGKKIAVLDTSAACHMPDVLEMPYRPEVIGAAAEGRRAHNYIFAGPTCLAGDIIGSYSFDTPLCVGDKVVFEDMAIYSMVKNNTFNGLNLPSIAVAGLNGNIRVVRSFGYEDFRSRLS